MHLTTKWDAVFAIRFGAVNDLWQADFSQEARWRAITRDAVLYVPDNGNKIVRVVR